MNDDCGSFEATGGFYLLLSDLDGIEKNFLRVT